jgi:hypothetical protein
MTQPRKSQEAAIEALLRHESISAAATSAKISRRTLQRWMRDPGFQRQLREARDISHGHALARLCELANKAVSVLEKALDGEPVSKGAFLAARAVLEFAGNAEVDDLRAQVESMRSELAGLIVGTEGAA